MEKKKKTKSRRLLGMTVGELCAVATFCAMVIAFIVGSVRYFDKKFESIDRKFENIDRRFEGIDHRFEKVEKRLDGIEGELRKTGDLLNNYLSWRFLYVNDPMRKHLVPRYDPVNRTLEFVDAKSKGKVISMDVQKANEYDF